MTKVDIENILISECHKAITNLRELLIDSPIQPKQIYPDYAILNIDNDTLIAIGLSWEIADLTTYSAKWDIQNSTISDVYIVYPVKGSKYVSSQIDVTTLEPIVHYKQAGNVEFKLDAATDEQLQKNTVIVDKKIPADIQAKMVGISFPYQDRVIMSSHKPYGTIVEFRIRGLAVCTS